MPEMTGKHLQWQLNILCVEAVISTTLYMSVAFLHFPTPSALLSLLLVTDNTFSQDNEQDCFALFLGLSLIMTCILRFLQAQLISLSRI